MEGGTVVTNPVGEIRNVAVLDLTGAKAPDGLDAVTRIENVAVVLVPEPLMQRLMSIPMANVATVVPVPAGADVKVQVGELTMSGEALAGGDQETYLVVVGELLITTPVQAVGYKGLIVVGEVIAPEGSETALAASLKRLMGGTIYYPAGGRVRTLSGEVKLSGAALANAGGSEDDILVVSGETVITSPVEKVGYRQIIANGQLLAPRESQAVLDPRLRVQGQVLYYSGTPRLFSGDDRFGKAFFELLKEPITMILMGSAVIEPDVTVDLIREKVTEIVLLGDLKAPKALLPILQVLAVEKQGEISAEGDE